MGQNSIALKRRIRSVRATKKITSAMELIATSKLQKQKHKMESNRFYAETLFSTFNRVLSQADLSESPFFKPSVGGKSCTIVFVSDMGLCGGYNSNILQSIRKHVAKEDYVFMIGAKERSNLKRHGYAIYGEIKHGDRLTYGQLTSVASSLVRAYLNHEISEIRVLYTRFVNTLTFEPTLINLLPFAPKDSEPSSSSGELKQDVIFEPDPNTLIAQLVPMVINSMMYSFWLEAKTSEHAARRMAMDNATDNAEELIEELVLKFNQTRQAAITQEITEIVAGAEAL
jgi:F-type H+-transporting ATPase subunit gamma